MMFMGSEGQFITSKGASKRKPDTNQSYLNREDHTNCGPTGGHKATTSDPRPGEGPPQARAHHYKPHNGNRIHSPRRCRSVQRSQTSRPPGPSPNPSTQTPYIK